MEIPDLTEKTLATERKYIGKRTKSQIFKIVVEYAMSRTMSPVMIAQYKQQFIPKEVLQRTFEEYLVLPGVFPEEKSMTCCRDQD